MTTGASRTLDDLAAKLVDPADRQAYADLLSYLRSLPPADEFRKLGELFGLLTLLGQRLPEALGAAMVELRNQADISNKFHRDLEKRLALLPGEITSQIEVAKVAKVLAETFRQQVKSVGLSESLAILASTAQSVKAQSGEVGVELQTVLRNYRALGTNLGNEVGKLLGASQRLQERNLQLLRQTRSSRRILRSLCLVAIFLGGGVAGIVVNHWPSFSFHSWTLSKVR